jgi:diguanylate cyclase (GGDEF)-like protein/PAS domain S-box-containing protein
VRPASGVLGSVDGLNWPGQEGGDWLFDPLPEAAALLSAPDGTLLRATERAAKLAGESSPAALVGRKLSDLLVDVGSISHLRGRHSTVPVRTASWRDPSRGQFQVTVLIDVSDLHRDDEDVTARLRVNDQVNRFIEAQRISRVGSWVFYPDSGEFECSPVLLDLFSQSSGNTPDEAFAMVAGVYPDDQPKAEQFHRDLMASNGEQRLEVELRGGAGDQVFLCTGRAEVDQTGRLERIHGTVQDVTEHRRLERELRDERRKLHDAQRVARLGTWVWNPETGRTHLSEMLCEIIGREHGEPSSFESYLDHTHPDDREWVREAWQPLVERHEPVEVEHRYVTADSSVRTLRLYGAAVVDSEGHSSLVGTAQDVTEQRAAVTRMERSSQRFTDLVSVTPVGIGLFDSSERLVDANDALCDLFGYRLDQLRGMAVVELAHPHENGFGLQEAFDGSEMPGSRRRTPQRLLVRSDGEPVYCELHVTLSVQDDGTRFWLVVFQDVTERRRTAEALLYQATHDELTGLPNRAAVKELLGRLLGGPDSAHVAVLFCDIDNFKRVNDSLGHDAGDELLVALARRLEGGLPDGCTAARLSGDEFLIICEDIGSVGGVDSLATKVSGLLRTAVPVLGQLIRVSASIGAAVPNGQGTAGADLLRFADAAMFEAKRRGAGRVSLASPALIASADRQLALEGQLREALHNDELELHYQPVVRSDGSIASAEALVRWPHPDRGLLSPGAFLPVAEQGDLVRELDRWVLRTALKEAAGWPTSEDRAVSIAVNLAGLVPGDRDFVDVVATTVADCGIAWRRVILELVETALVDLPSRSRQAMGELVERGVRFAVDDFGTGYSSLARLKDLPAQIIKVDRRFVAGVGGDASDFAVTRAVVDMARAMGRQCVAEGVETSTQFHVLSGVGVDFYQGWLFSRPVPAPDFRALLAKGPLRVPGRS